ncbi:zinc transporter ZIP3-like [Diadema setosum]|uniref:zinc transporter ZIP3-like n=1 Tax=Diadema setosum TaxID=31175 RepID=UPI003B3AAFBC
MEANIKILLPVCIVIVFLVTLVGALLPLKVFGRQASQSKAQWQRSEKIRNLCNCLAGGVFMGTCFLGLLPSARRKFEDVFERSNYQTDYPVCEAVVIAGFFLILVLEQVMTAFQQKVHTVEYVQLQQLEADLDLSQESSDHDGTMDVEDDDEYVILQSPSQNQLNGGARGDSSYDVHISNHSHDHQGGHSHFANLDSSNFLHSLILLLALSVHSVFEGMALGLQEDIKQIVYLLVAMVAHESLAAFALGASLLKSKTRLCAFVTFSVIFSSMIPVGTAIGVGIQATPSFATDVCSAIMQALAAGIFIYVTFFEILSHEFENGNHRGLKLTCAIAGFTALALLEVVG